MARLFFSIGIFGALFLTIDLIDNWCWKRTSRYREYGISSGNVALNTNTQQPDELAFLKFKKRIENYRRLGWNVQVTRRGFGLVASYGKPRE
jgi:hypothetical protein